MYMKRVRKKKWNGSYTPGFEAAPHPASIFGGAANKECEVRLS